MTDAVNSVHFSGKIVTTPYKYKIHIAPELIVVGMRFKLCRSTVTGATLKETSIS